MRVAIIAGLVGLLINAPGNQAWADDPEAANVLNKVGERRYYHGVLVLKVYEDRGKLTYRVTRVHGSGAGSAGPSVAAIEPDSGWFLFPESANKVWIFDGDDALMLDEFDGLGKTTYSCSKGNPGLVNKAPNVVRERLPKSF